MYIKAYRQGFDAALRKYAGTFYGVPSSLRSPASERIDYPTRTRSHSDVGDPAAQARASGNVDWAWEKSDISRMAPGNVSGYGDEKIGRAKNTLLNQGF